MEKYQKIEEVGRGSYGVVWKSLNNQTGETVAIKKIKTMYLSSEECMNLTDVKSLIKMNHHPNIIKLKEIIRENHNTFLVYEYMECSLYKSMVERKKPFSETEVQNLCFKVFQGLAYMHRNGNFHHDLKPDSFFVNKKNDVIIKIDLGHAREMNGNSPCTDYVTGCWYRAPEIILDLSVYNYAVDMWAMGAIMVELFTLKPVFQGSSEVKVLGKICSLLGTPKDQDLASEINFIFPEIPAGVSISELLPCARPDAVDLIATLLSWNPKNRPTAMEALQHRFFNRSVTMLHHSSHMNSLRNAAGLSEAGNNFEIKQVVC